MNTREYRRPEWNVCLGKTVMTELTESQVHLIRKVLNAEELVEFFILHHQDSKWIKFSEHPKLHNPNDPPREFSTPPIEKIKRPASIPPQPPPVGPPPQSVATPATKTKGVTVSFELQGLKKTPAQLVSMNGPNVILDTAIESNFQFFVVHAKASDKDFDLVGFRGPDQQKIPNLIQLLPSSDLPSFMVTLGGRTEG